MLPRALSTLHSAVCVLFLLPLGINARGEGWDIGTQAGNSLSLFNLSFDLGGPIAAMDFFQMVVITVVTITQFIAATFVFFRKEKNIEHDFPLRTQYRILTISASAILASYYGLSTKSWLNDNKATLTPLASAFYAFMDLFTRSADILLCIAITILLRHRRSSLTFERVPDQRSVRSYFRRFWPWPIFSLMLITVIIRFGILIGTNPQRPGFPSFLWVVPNGDVPPSCQPPFVGWCRINYTFTIMAHLYLAFYLVVVAILTKLAISLWPRIKTQKPLTFYDRLVISRVVKIVVPALVVKGTNDLFVHILNYTWWLPESFDRFAFVASTLVIQPLLSWFLLWSMLRVGLPSDSAEGKEDGEDGEKVKLMGASHH